MKLITPFTIEETTISSGTTVPELTANEVAWATATAYPVGRVVTLASLKKRYYCLVAHTSGGASETPNTLSDKWHDLGRNVPLWVSGTAFAVDDLTYREETGHMYRCKLAIASSTAAPETDTTYFVDAGPIDIPWKSGVNYVVNQVRSRSTTHRVYKCAVAHTSTTTNAPELDENTWVDMGPTARRAPFDNYTSTPATAYGSLTYVLRPGYFNSVALLGLRGTSYDITVRETPGGAILEHFSGYLLEDVPDWYEYLFSPERTLTKIVLTNLAIRPDAELTVTITGAEADTVSIGLIVVGDCVPLVSGQWGGTQYGSTAEPVTYSYINTAEDGTTTIKRRHSGTNIRARVALPQSEMDYAIQTIQQVLDVPVMWIATDVAGYNGLSAFGLGSTVGTYESFSTGTLEILVKGLI